MVKRCIGDFCNNFKKANYCSKSRSFHIFQSYWRYIKKYASKLTHTVLAVHMNYAPPIPHCIILSCDRHYSLFPIFLCCTLVLSIHFVIIKTANTAESAKNGFMLSSDKTGITFSYIHTYCLGTATLGTTLVYTVKYGQKCYFYLFFYLNNIQ